MLYSKLPENVEEAVEKLISELPLKDRVFIAKLDRKDLPTSNVGKMKVEAIICLGGDGTLLRVLKTAKKPVLGINAATARQRLAWRLRAWLWWAQAAEKA